jgi:hypothetical protein
MRNIGARATLHLGNFDQEDRMADERENNQDLPKHPANEDKVQTPGREANAARPLNESDEAQGSNDSKPVQESRSFDSRGALAQNSGTSHGADAETPPSANEGRLGPGADPAEGKR